MNILKQIPCRPQLSERMKVVDVISSRVYSDSQQIIAQVISLFVRFSYFCYIYSYNHLNASALQGDLADCFYIVESGQVRITMKRSRVCLKKKKKASEAERCTVVASGIQCFSVFLCQTKKDQEEEEVDIATCSRGQYFGELALVTNKPRAASAYAVGSVKCLGTF